MDNILKVFSMATQEEINSGMGWYSMAHDLAKELSPIANCDLAHSAYAVSALSPRTSWADNVRSAVACAEHVRDGLPGYPTRYPALRSTFSNLEKACGLFRGMPLETIGKGEKTNAFAHNILYPTSSQEVTIDGWAYRIYAGLIGITDELSVTIRGKVYLEAAYAYKAAAQYTGLLPLELQAITWVTAHRLEGK